jgi:hypothetical protein
VKISFLHEIESAHSQHLQLINQSASLLQRLVFLIKNNQAGGIARVAAEADEYLKNYRDYVKPLSVEITD